MVSNKHYFNKEIAYAFRHVYKLDFDGNAIEEYDFLKELFHFLLLELNGRIDGASYLLEEVKIGDKIDDALIEDEDRYIFEDYEDCEFDAIVYNEECQAIAIKRLEALQVFRDSIDLLKRMFYNADIHDLEKLAKDHQRRNQNGF